MILGRIFIKDLIVSCVIGVGEEERKTKQKLLVSVILWIDNIAVSSKTDNLGDTVNYSFLRKEIIAFVKASKFHLL